MNNEKNNTLLCKLSRKLTNYWKKSYFSSIIYPNKEKIILKSSILSEVKKITGKENLFRPLKTYLAKTIDNSFIIQKVMSFFEYLLSVSIRCYSFALTSFFVFSFILSELNDTLTDRGIISSSVAVLVLIPLFFSKKSISQMICDSGIISYVFLELIRFERLKIYSQKKTKGNANGWLIAGILFSLLTLVYSKETILLSIFAIVATAMFMCRPEVSPLSIALIVPFAPIRVILFFTFISLLSYLTKVIRGKRSFYFKRYDIPALAIFLLFSFVSKKDSSWYVAIPLCLLYIIFCGMLRNENLILRCLANLCASTTLIATYNIVKYFIDNKFTSFSILLTDEVRNSTNFSNSQSTSAFYAVSLIICICFVLFRSEKKPLYIVASAINLIALTFCGVSLALPAVILGVMFMCLCLYKNKIVCIFVSTAFVSLSLKLIAIFEGTYNGFSISVKLIEKYSKYALFGTDNSNLIYRAEGIENAGSVWGQLLFDGGFLITILIFIFTFFFVRNCFAIKNDNTFERAKYIRIVISASILTYIITSFGCYIWNDYKVFCLFWILGGLSSSIRRNTIQNSEIQSIMFPDKED